MQSEAYIQQEIVLYFNNTYCLKHHTPRSLIMSVPNDGAPGMLRTGLLPGASDLIVLHNSQIWFVEVKNDKGRQSDKQRDFEQRVTALGYRYVLVRSLDEFKTALNV